MDPFLEGHLWPDVHNSLAYLFKVQLADRLPDAYTAHLNTYTVLDTDSEKDIGIMYPDVELFRSDRAEEPSAEYEALLTPSTTVLPTPKAIPVPIPVVEVRDRVGNQLVTAVELLSPVNKRKPGLAAYRHKCQKLHSAGVHLIEVDLLRRGERPVRHPRLPKAEYMASLWRAGEEKVEIWAISLQDKLPVLPVPLLEGEESIYLDVQQAFTDMYEQGKMERAINYKSLELLPPPVLSQEMLDWLNERLKSF
jgi:hypothetical protein